ncbi:restriction endonuclease [Cronobacter sakazakii]|uniref:restriction endonuclease n=1 Tax=Cronobacter sakazakii TaxID=28141 RepID=UPI001BCE1501|nr:restriction endonuclease [Cronobacter sakazakii]ELQ6072659.1 restriction endonuclease [Cronobacter sakazakii]ELY2665666.1 restriction endonuclease [Cronobacter sakazakii]ELY4372113.1 restriction endonuclease [Cronobacter sakazakii]MBS4468191.1 restriction endonuclease [Cronobacter sakazakii]MBS4472570.1 restriction endonuclease [Cronobacter sakazakii]
MQKNTGKEYEEFVGAIQQSLINAEGMSHLKNIKVELNKKIEDRSGILRQFDVYWEFNLGGYDYKTVIECKDYTSTVTIDKIDAFIGKTQDIPGLRLIYATKTGYQSGAQKKAEQHKIDLLIIREGVDEDWTAPDGTPLIKTINLSIIATSPPNITSFSPCVDASWLESQPDLDIEKINKKFSMTLNNEVFICNEVSGVRFSLYDLANSLTSKIPDIQYGEGTYSEELHDSYLESADGVLRVKLRGYKLSYLYHEPAKVTSIIDYSKELLGIVQNYSSEDKQMVFRNGRVK